MSYQALYRKFRPLKFSDLIGQEHIVKTLTNQIVSGRTSHAYIFCGTRGTGKTSTAKILARALNCENISEHGEPCGKCGMCQAAIEGRSMNIIEIDAASNNGVDNIREINEEVKYPPAEGKYRVYIIDEVHMLSIGAFNALLKTLEEPPAHVVFILATTDPQKVPITILSRCQRFDFKRISSNDIASALKEYSQSENIDIDSDALLYIARVSDGSMRDSLSLLDQCAAFYYNENITLEKVLKTVGAVDNTVFFDMAEAVAKKDALKALDIIESIQEQGRDISRFVADLIAHYRNILIVSAIDTPKNIIDSSVENIQKLSEQSKYITSEQTVYIIKTLSQLLNDMKYSYSERILFEVCIIKMCSGTAEHNYDGLASRISALENDIKTGKLVLSSEKTEIDKKSTETKQNKTSNKSPEKQAASKELKSVSEAWETIKNSFPPMFSALFKSSEIQPKGDGFYIVTDDGSAEDIVKNKLNEIKSRLKESTGSDVNISVICRTDYMNKLSAEYDEENSEYIDTAQITNIFPDVDVY